VPNRNNSVYPQHKDSNRVIDIGDSDGFGELSLHMARSGKRNVCQESNILGNSVTNLRFMAINDDFPIGFQIAHMVMPVHVDIVEERHMRKMTVKGEVTEELFGDNPIDQLEIQVGMTPNVMFGIALITIQRTSATSAIGCVFLFRQSPTRFQCFNNARIRVATKELDCLILICRFICKKLLPFGIAPLVVYCHRTNKFCTFRVAIDFSLQNLSNYLATQKELPSLCEIRSCKTAC
jgi:hypothetical protein